jgi:hypothetical protein
MGANKIDLEAVKVFGVDALARQAAKAGVDAVDRIAGGNQAGDGVGAGLDARLGCRSG